MAKDELVRLQVDVPKKLRTAFRIRCLQLDVTMGERLAEMIREEIQNRAPSQ